MILVTNDDGVHAPGLAALVKALSGRRGVRIAAPAREHSATSHAISLHTPLRVEDLRRDGRLRGWVIHGTPVDCVKLAVQSLLPRRPQLVISGVNPGSNTGLDALYSGTVAAAMEGMILGIPSIAISVTTPRPRYFETAASVAARLADRILRQGLPPGILLNVNVPDVPLSQLRGLRITRQGTGRFREFYEKSVSPRGVDHYWLGGKKAPDLSGPDCDDHAVENGYASVTPFRHRWTAEDFLEELTGWGL